MRVMRFALFQSITELVSVSLRTLRLPLIPPHIDTVKAHNVQAYFILREPIQDVGEDMNEAAGTGGRERATAAGGAGRGGAATEACRAGPGMLSPSNPRPRVYGIPPKGGREARLRHEYQSHVH